VLRPRGLGRLALPTGACSDDSKRNVRGALACSPACAAWPLGFHERILQSNSSDRLSGVQVLGENLLSPLLIAAATISASQKPILAASSIRKACLISAGVVATHQKAKWSTTKSSFIFRHGGG